MLSSMVGVQCSGGVRKTLNECTYKYKITNYDNHNYRERIIRKNNEVKLIPLGGGEGQAYYF